ncbi:MAG TPA: rRNA maturation RNase YbeY [Bacteroidota bacterium]|nr:rRNA maturation RNase YbeY [Bacteroidota bacterium]
MIEVSVAFAAKNPGLRSRAVQRAVELVLRGEKIAGGRISCVFVADRRMRSLNIRYLGHASTTDVITFPIENPPSLEAEIYVNVDQARRQASAYGVTLTNELIRLLVHGVLHAVGYDDTRTNQRKKMFVRQEAYVRRCAVALRSI